MAKYIEIRNEILSKIRSGEWQPGDRLPTREEMLNQFKVTRTTLDKAISALNSRGILNSHVKKGTFVATSQIKKKVALVYKLSLMDNPFSRYSIRDIGLFFYSVLTQSNHIEFEFIDMGKTIKNPRVLNEFDISVWIQPSQKIIDSFNKINTPFIVINRILKGFNCISTDHKKSCYEITKELLKLINGDFQLVCIHSPNMSRMAHAERTEGFISACEENNHFYRLISSEKNYEETYGKLVKYFKDKKKLLIVCASSGYTGAVMALANEYDYEYGRDIFYSDFDNLNFKNVQGVENATVIQNYYEMGQKLIEVIDRLGGEPIQIMVPHEIHHLPIKKR